MPSRPASALADVAAVFLKLGCTAFGGPAAHVALMEDELVRRRRWVTHEEFLDLLGATMLIPGPNSTELAIHLGYRRAGWPGLLVAGLCFIVPAAVITTAFAVAYVRYGSLPQVGAVLYGVKPVVIAVIAQALWALTPRAARTHRLAVIGLAAAVAATLGAAEIPVLVGAGVLALVFARSPAQPSAKRIPAPDQPPKAPLPAVLFAAPPIVAAATAPTWAVVFLIFIKIGSVLYGSGYVLLAFLRTEFVDRRPWLTEAQLIDAVAVGQFTPGPVFSTATFVGFILNGYSGAIAATVGIFLPAFILVAISGPLVPKLRRSPAAGAILDGVNVASLAIMGVVAMQLARASLIDLVSAGLAVASLVALMAFRVNSAWLILAGAGLGLLARAFG